MQAHRRGGDSAGSGKRVLRVPRPDDKVKPARYPINRRWFLDKLESHDPPLQQQDLAKYIGCRPASLSQLLRGQRQMRPREVAELARLFGVTQDEVLVQIGVRPSEVQDQAATVPISGWVDGALMVHGGPPAKGPKRAPLPALGGKDLRVLRIQSANSELAMMDGALIYYRPSQVVEPDAIGKQCVVRVVGQDLEAVRYVTRGYREGRYHLAMMDGRVKEEDVPLVSATPVLWTRW